MGGVPPVRTGGLVRAAAAYSIAFPDSTPLNVNKKKRSL